MAAKNRPKSGDGPLGAEETETKPLVPLSMAQRARLVEILTDPVFKQAWNNALTYRPSVVPAGLDSALGPQIGNNRLHQLQGWEMFRVALLRQQLEPKLPAPRITQEQYPDSGTLEAEVKRRLESV